MKENENENGFRQVVRFISNHFHIMEFITHESATLSLKLFFDCYFVLSVFQ